MKSFGDEILFIDLADCIKSQSVDSKRLMCVTLLDGRRVVFIHYSRLL
jgi:hypothetical protein